MWIRKGLRYVFMAQETGGEGSSGGSGAAEGGTESTTATSEGQSGAADGTAGANNGSPDGSASGTPAGSTAEGTALAKGQEGAAGQTVAIPEKYQVKKEDGSIDIEASSLKLAEAYGHLERRIGTGDLPPKSAEEYQINVPDQFKEFVDPNADPLLKEFTQAAHTAGLTQKQIDFVMGEYFKRAPQLVEGSRQLSEEECTTQLQAEWKTPEQYKAEVGKAYKAAVGYGGSDAEGIVKDYGNDPRIVRLLARVGAEMGEDSSVKAEGGIAGGQSVESLMMSEAYTNPKHADHARVSKQVQEHFAKQSKAGAEPLM